jgi:hypothetical protein
MGGNHHSPASEAIVESKVVLGMTLSGAYFIWHLWRQIGKAIVAETYFA